MLLITESYKQRRIEIFMFSMSPPPPKKKSSSKELDFAAAKKLVRRHIPLDDRIHDLYHITGFVLLRVLQESHHSIFLVDKRMYLTILDLHITVI